jgi:CheY-like chemotaxis protein/anti-sigma regulatory factor (Ser/Thr protein kinase)
MVAGKLRLDLRNTLLLESVRLAVDAVRANASTRGIALETHLDDEIGIVRADPERIQQVVGNLLSNAVKFTPSGGQVRIDLVRKGDIVELSVADTGIGIRSDFLPHVFERFRQAETVSTRQHSGLGLGLSIARELVELHAGSISAHSKGIGQGATFTVRIPLPAQAQGGRLEGSTVSPATRGLRGIRILVVEDEPATSAAVRRLLEIAGAQVQVVASATSAREAYAIQRPDLILCDIGLPGEDGYSLLRLIREGEQSRSQARIPAVAVTAFAGRQDREYALTAGFDEHIPKPVEPARLLAVIEKLIRDSRT